MMRVPPSGVAMVFFSAPNIGQWDCLRRPKKELKVNTPRQEALHASTCLQMHVAKKCYRMTMRFRISGFTVYRYLGFPPTSEHLLRSSTEMAKTMP